MHTSLSTKWFKEMQIVYKKLLYTLLTITSSKWFWINIYFQRKKKSIPSQFMNYWLHHIKFKSQYGNSLLGFFLLQTSTVVWSQIANWSSRLNGVKAPIIFLTLRFYSSKIHMVAVYRCSMSSCQRQPRHSTYESKLQQQRLKHSIPIAIDGSPSRSFRA